MLEWWFYKGITMKAGRPQNTPEILWSKVDVRKPDECWPWVGHRDGKGYGRMYAAGKSFRAPRLSWVIFNNVTIPEGHYACHKCDNPPCVNPNHIWIGTHAENMRDSAEKGRQSNSKKTHCRQGHPYSGENLSVDGAGIRRCRQCWRDRANRANRARNMAKEK